MLKKFKKRNSDTIEIEIKIGVLVIYFVVSWCVCVVCGVWCVVCLVCLCGVCLVLDMTVKNKKDWL